MKISEKLGIMKIDIGDGGRNLGFLSITIHIPTYHHIFKGHMVTGQCSGFIWKYVLNLTQFLVQGASLNCYLGILLPLKFTITDVDSLNVLHHLQRNNQWYWHEISEEEDPTPPLDEELLKWTALLLKEGEWTQHSGNQWTQKGQYHLHNEDSSYNQSHSKFQPWFFGSSWVGIQHNLTINTSVNDQSNCPFSYPQCASPQSNVIVVEGNLVIWTRKRVNVGVRSFISELFPHCTQLQLFKGW